MSSVVSNLLCIFLALKLYYKYIIDEVEEVLYIDNGSEEIEKNQTSSDKNNEILEEKAPSVSGDDEKCYSDSQTGEK